MQSATLLINKYEMTHNEELMRDFRISIENIKSGSLVNIEFMLLQDVTKMLIYGRFNIPESSDDREYKKEVLQSVIDVDRLFKGVATNFIAKTVIDEFGKSMNFERKFPIKKVSCFKVSYRMSLNFFPQGLIKFTNTTITDKLWPSIFKKALFNVRCVGKFFGSKKMTFLSEYKIFMEVK